MLKNWDWKHTALTLCGIGALVCQGIAQWGTTNPLPWHLTTAGFVTATAVFGYLSKQLGGGSSSAS